MRKLRSSLDLTRLQYRFTQVLDAAIDCEMSVEFADGQPLILELRGDEAMVARVRDYAESEELKFNVNYDGCKIDLRTQEADHE